MSIRTRLTLYFTGFFTCALLLVGFGIFIAVKQALEQGVRSDLEAGTQQVLAIYWRSPASGLDLVVRNGVIGLVTPEQLSGRPAEIFVNPNLFVQVFSPDGDFLGSSMPAGDFLGSEIEIDTQMLDLPPEALLLQPGQQMYSTQYVDGTRIRSLITAVGLARTGRSVGILQVSRPLNDVEETMQALLTILLGGGAIAMVGTAIGVAGLSRTALSPIDQVVRTARSIVRAEDLQQRVPVPPSQDELQRLSITINDLLERLEELFTMQRRLVADVSHELRTPLAAMQGNLEVLQRGAHRNPELLAESLADMRQETARLIRMVNDLLLLAKSEARVQKSHAPVELDTLLLEVHRELRPLAGGVRLNIGAEDQVVLPGDRDQIKQALLNLGVNAIQHTPTGGSVTLSLEQCGGFACIAVRDTGNGIAPEELHLIFKRFYRSDPSRSRMGGGAGLGLAIVEHVAESHGGRVAVDSIPGEGSTFTIWLPLASEPPSNGSNPAANQPNAPLLGQSAGEPHYG
jgi:signal transduction histidine kinase